MSGERISSALPSLINGVSQQAQGFRLPSQCELQINALSSVLDGVSKRPPSTHMAKITTGVLDKPFVHVIDRDAEERYVVLVTNGNLRVFDIMNGGAECTVNFPNGKAYLNTLDPQSTFRMTTVADYTFVVNRNVEVRMDPKESLEVEKNQAIVYIKKGVINTTYKVMVNGTWMSYTTPSPTTTVSGSTTTQNGTSTTKDDKTTSSSTQTTSATTTTQNGSQPSTDEIANALASQIRSRSGFVVDVIGSSIRVYRSDNADFSFAVTDSWGNEASMAIKREVQKFQDLPARAWDGFRVRIVGENPTRDDDYYLEYSSDSFYKNGVWKETRGWNQRNRFDASTMPHTLVREADGTFTFKQATWKERKAGDDYSNPWPSFVEGKIQDVFFYRNRLGVIVDENVVMSEAAGFFQFWPDTATTVLATHPIDIAVTNDKVSLLRHALVFEESLVLFADQVQFQLTSGGQPNLAPDTVKVDKTTEYNCFKNCAPVHSGQSLYFATEKGDFAGIREYTVEADAVSAYAPEITSHVPEYLPKGLFKLAVAINDGTLFGVSRTTPNTVYVYRYFWVGDEKVQSCWSSWVFAKDADILSVATIDSWLFLVVQYPDGVYLERVDLNSKGEKEAMGHKVFLDRKVRLKGTYNAATDQTSWSFPYVVNADEVVMLLSAACDGYPAGLSVIGLTNTNSATLSAPGDFSGVEVIAGLDYEMRFRFSQLFIRESKDPGATVVQEGRFQLLDMSLTYKDSGFFQVEVSTPGRRANVKEHKGSLGTFNFFTGKPTIESGQFKFLVLARNDRATIDIVNPKHYPSCFQAAEWTGTYTSDASRR